MSEFQFGLASDARFAWLFGVSEPPSKQKILSQDFEEACQFALSNWHVLQVTVPRLRDWAGEPYENHPIWNFFEERLLSLRFLGRIRLTALRRIAEASTNNRIPYVLLKGTATAFSAYSHPAQRVGEDIDIGVPSEFLNDFKDALDTLGFEPAQWFDNQGVFRKPNLAERAAVEAIHYELGFLVRRQTIQNLTTAEESIIRKNLKFEPKPTWHITADDRLACYVVIDVHHGLLHSIDVKPAVFAHKEIDYRGQSLRIVSNAWALFHLILKIYLEGVNSYGSGGYQYADLSRLIQASNETDIHEFLALLTKYKLHAAAYYVLRRLKSEFNMDLSPALQSFLHCAAVPITGSTPHQENDFGDMWHKLWGRR